MHEDISAMLAEARRISETARASSEPWSLRRLVLVGGMIATGYGLAGGFMLWLGGEMVGPGAKYEADRRAAARNDSLANIDRERLMLYARQLNAIVARQGYGICTALEKRAESECLDTYTIVLNRNPGDPATIQRP